MVRESYEPLELKDRVRLISRSLEKYLPQDYPEAITILMQIMGDPNPNETGMFTNYYWLMPVGQFIENNGLDHFDLSMKAIYELTQRNTGEYTVRPFIKQYPKESLKYFKKWSKDKSFHVRRLSCEGLRPKLPWASKLDHFITDYQSVFSILETLKEDKVKFVKKSVANHIGDYLKVNREAAMQLINEWSLSENPDTQWIIKHGTRTLRR